MPTFLGEDQIDVVQKFKQGNAIFVVMGGSHLSEENEKLIDRTISEMKVIDPDYFILMHCTGGNTITRFA